MVDSIILSQDIPQTGGHVLRERHYERLRSSDFCTGDWKGRLSHWGFSHRQLVGRTVTTAYNVRSFGKRHWRQWRIHTECLRSS